MSKVAAVTGGAQGIGKAVCLAFAKAGYEIAAADTDREAGLELVHTLRRFGGKGMFSNTDIGNPEDITRWFGLIREQLGRVDVLINNAATSANRPVLELSAEQFDRVIGVNLRGAFLCSQQAAALMKEQGSGSIVNIASTRALMSEANTEAYSASKGGLLALTHAMAVSLGPLGIRVNAVSPGWIETRYWQKSSARTTPVHSERDRLQHPVGRVGMPEDIAAACLYLSGPQAGFITGQNIVVDGGMTVKMIYEE